jgi:hypothetical protein
VKGGETKEWDERRRTIFAGTWWKDGGVGDEMEVCRPP